MMPWYPVFLRRDKEGGSRREGRWRGTGVVEDGGNIRIYYVRKKVIFNQRKKTK